MKSTEYDESYEIEETKAVRVSLHMIVKRHLPPTANKWKHDEITTALNRITHLRMDRENIGHIDNLELLGKKVTNVYLQHNRIQKIENLDCLQNLSFLTLAANQISKIEGLAHLHKLGFLDLSKNQIKSVDIDELPQSVVILTLKDNPCTSVPDYRGRIVQDLPKLRQLDGIEVTKTEKLEAGFQMSSSEEESDEDDNFDLKDEPHRHSIDNSDDAFREAATDILLRSQSRLEEAMQQHLENIAELDDIRIKEDLPPSARHMSSRLAASARLSASRSSNALREQLRAARTATATSVSLHVDKRKIEIPLS